MIYLKNKKGTDIVEILQLCQVDVKFYLYFKYIEINEMLWYNYLQNSAIFAD